MTPTIIIPLPLLVAVEDVGWWSGHSCSEANGPFRTGAGRMHVPEDYQALIRLAKSLKTQILAGFVLCEWDRKGILRDLPSATWRGHKWPGCTASQEHQGKVVWMLNENPDCVLLAMHGVGHEYWTDGTASRTEFHDEKGGMRDKDQIKRHISFFAKILESSGLHASFPKVFIPPGLKHSFGDGDRGFQRILSDYGVGFVLTVFGKARQFNPPKTPHVTWECGVTLIERGLSPVPWDLLHAKPQFDFSQPVLPLHWANILHRDPEKNGDVVDAWASFLEEGARKNGFVLLPDAMDSLAQIVFYHLIRIVPVDDGAVLDLSDLRWLGSELTRRGFYAELPPCARMEKREGFMESADDIRPGLFKLFPVENRDRVRILF